MYIHMYAAASDTALKKTQLALSRCPESARALNTGCPPEATVIRLTHTKRCKYEFYSVGIATA